MREHGSFFCAHGLGMEKDRPGLLGPAGLRRTGSMAGRSVRRGKKGIGFMGCRAAIGDGADHQRLSRAQIASGKP